MATNSDKKKYSMSKHRQRFWQNLATLCMISCSQLEKLKLTL